MSDGASVIHWPPGSQPAPRGDTGDSAVVQGGTQRWESQAGFGGRKTTWTR